MSFYTDKEALEKRYAKEVEKAERIIGGYKISILNHASRTEKKYNITSTDGNYYATNDRDDFYKQLKLLV